VGVFSLFKAMRDFHVLPRKNSLSHFPLHRTYTHMPPRKIPTHKIPQTLKHSAPTHVIPFSPLPHFSGGARPACPPGQRSG
jgi:hypothetical protein